MFRCPRCSLETQFSTCSWFTTEQICVKCSDEEERAPNYKKARQAEREAIKAGDFNFPGIGLTPEDEVVLSVLRQARRRNELGTPN